MSCHKFVTALLAAFALTSVGATHAVEQQSRFPDEPSLFERYTSNAQDLILKGLELVGIHSTLADGMAAVGTVQPDLVVLDINMPGMNGIEVLRQMKELRATMPVILNSAYQEYKQDFGSWASEAYVVKSANMDELKATVRKYLS